ncbi:MAG: M48 family metalloprotease [Bryobacterales bacterium]|nr:M48 family metalloprotease [Bryobacterales bacterium]
MTRATRFRSLTYKNSKSPNGELRFSLLFRPVDLVLSVLVHVFSRRHEFEADRFAAETTGSGAPLVGALKKLAADNLSNLTPHPMDVFLHYSHPPVLQRIGALVRLSARSASPLR